VSAAVDGAAVGGAGGDVAASDVAASDVAIAEVVRSGFVEGRHYGRVLALAADGSAVIALGAVDEPIFPRSANKPLQAVGMLRAGLDLEGPLLALAAASHAGTDAHVRLAEEILTRYRIDPEALANTPMLPLDEAVSRDRLAHGLGEDRLRANCSGKHAAMLATCAVAGWPTSGYLEAGHPLQLALRDTAAELAGEAVAATGVDGCGAPVFAMSLRGLARAFRRLVRAEPGTPERRVADAMRAHPWVVAGHGRGVTLLMEGVPGLLVKDGAEGVLAAALPDGRVVTVKMSDGAGRGVLPVAVASLRELGVDAAVLEELASTPVLGHGVAVGAVRATGIGAPG